MELILKLNYNGLFYEDVDVFQPMWDVPQGVRGVFDDSWFMWLIQIKVCVGPIECCHPHSTTFTRNEIVAVKTLTTSNFETM